MRTDQDRMADLLAQGEIRDVLFRYCRGIDRRRYDLVRSCYHADATDDHGDYAGGLDGFITHAETNLPRFVRTMHFLGNILIEVEGRRARSEAYCLAFHHLRANDRKPARDFVVGLRYVDDFEDRGDGWRIASRVCVFEWTRIDAVADGGYEFPARAHLGRFGSDDVVFASVLPRETAMHGT
ncbi:MAG: nuclear transport factor 2 family protein [Acidimicrobiales bacterium]